MMQTVFLVSATVLGACVGSFLNVVIYRVPAGTFFRGGRRSRCPKCGAGIAWFDNIPVLSWALLLRGRARCCGNAVSARYPLVEVLTAGLIAALFWQVFCATGSCEALVHFGARWAQFAFGVWFLGFLVACTFIDIDHRILPDVLTKPTTGVGLLAAVLVPPIHAVPGMGWGFASTPDRFDAVLFSSVGAATGYALTAAIRAGASKVFGEEAMGRGDLKFMMAIGAFVGWDGAVLTFFLGCVLGAVYGILHQWITGERKIYFGPFLAAGAATTLFFKPGIVEFITETWPQWQASAAVPPWVIAAVAVVCSALLLIIIRRARK